MHGLIRKRDILIHPIIVIRCFGWGVFLKTIFSIKGHSFLEILNEKVPVPLSSEQRKGARLLERLTSFELRSSFVYARLADIFQTRPTALRFFRMLSHQEEGHAELLRITKAEIALRNQWASIQPVKETTLEQIDQELTYVEQSIRYPASISFKEGIEIVEALESSEMNAIFDFLIHSIHLPHLQKIDKIMPTIAQHHSFISKELPALKEEAEKEA